MKVLVVDDNTEHRDMMALVLKSLGHTAVTAHDGQAAWTAFDREPVRVVVSDWQMPVIDGLMLCRKIRERPKTDYAYFILLTGKTTREDYLEAMECGVDDFLTKPLDKEALWIRLRVAERIISLTSRIRQLEGIIPICAYCKRIRRDDQVYQQMEAYIEEHSLAVFSHGICPDCMAKANKPGFGSRRG